MTARQQIAQASPFDTKGVDVSHHNGTVDWPAVARAGIAFAWVRTGDVGASAGPEDRQWAANWRGARAAGIRRGPYQYFRAAYGGAAQAERLLAQVEAAGGWAPGDMPPALDLEEAGQVTRDDQPLLSTTVLDEVRAWVAVIRTRTGRDPVIYAGQYFHWKFSQHGLGSEFGHLPAWMPSYGTTHCLMPVDTRGRPSPFPRWAFWQYSNRGTVDGIRGNVDLNWYAGSGADLERWAGRMASGPEAPAGKPGVYDAALAQAQADLSTLAPSTARSLALALVFIGASFLLLGGDSS